MPQKTTAPPEKARAVPAGRARARVRAAALGAAILLCAYFLLRYSAASAAGISAGLSRCAEVLIPSLFPFMALASFCVHSGFAARCGRLLSPVTKGLFYLPGSTATTIFMSMIGGFPTGVRGVRALLDAGEIDEEQARRMLLFCVGAGPGFVIGAVGSSLLKNPLAGALLFGAQVASSLLIGIAAGLQARRREKRKGRLPAPRAQKGEGPVPAAEALVRSTADAAQGMFAMCAFVILFSALLAVLEAAGASGAMVGLLLKTGLPREICEALPALLLEVTAGVTAGAQGGRYAVPLLSLALGWTGLSVHFQIYSSLTGVRYSKLRFMAGRAAQAALSALLSTALFLLLPQETIGVFAPTAPVEARLFSTAPFCAALLFMMGIFLVSLPRGGVDFSRRKC